MFLIRPEFLARHKSALLSGLIDASLATIRVKMAPITEVRERVIASRLPSPSSLSPWRIAAIGEIYGLFPSLLGENWHGMNLFRIEGINLFPTVCSPGESVL
jgi:hypothetical protein